MALRALIASLEDVEENIRPLYVQHGDKFKLDVEASEGFQLDNVTNLKKTIDAERAFHKEYKAKVAAFGDLDPETARSAISRVAEYGDLDLKKAKDALAVYEKFSNFNPEVEADKLAQEKFKNAKAQLQAEFQADKVTWENQLKTQNEVLARREAQIKKGLKETAISSELSKLNPIEDARDALEMIAGNAISMHEVNGEFVPVVVSSDGSPRTKYNENYETVPFTISDLMAELRDKRAALFKPDNTRGAGIAPTTEGKPAAPQGSKNPFIPGPNFNLTEQAILLKTDPTRALALQAEAGR